MDRRDGKNLAQLLQELGKLEGLRWIRLLYCYPRQAERGQSLGGCDNRHPRPLQRALCGAPYGGCAMLERAAPLPLMPLSPCSYFSEDLIDEIANNPKARLPALWL